MTPWRIAIDGPSGSGKSTLAAALAHRLGVRHLDTGAMYRAVALACLDAGVDPADEEACTDVAQDVELRFDGSRLLLDGTDVTERLRTPEVNEAVSPVSAHRGVREALVPQQRAALEHGGVAEGRDIGSVVIPDADLKVWLTADEDERVKRRAEQLGLDPDDPVVESDVRRRDQKDAARTVTPMAPVEDAWELDTTGMDAEEVVDEIVDRLGGRDVVAVRGWRQLPRVAIVGRPNVGKSTLVNRILGRRVAIVEEQPGVTRDRTEHRAEWLGREFVLIDTGGWEHAAEGMDAAIVASAEAAIADADLVIFVTDITVGVLEDDERYAKLLRRAGVDVVLVGNKADAERHELGAAELWRLGLGEPYPISARHGRGVGDLLDVVFEGLGDWEVAAAPARVPRVALVGKPNVGKSSLFNRLLGEDRSIVDAVPHTTRDAVDTLVEIDGRAWEFVDTAGMRRKYRTGEDVELYSVDRTRLAIESADLVLFLIDGGDEVSEQDQRLAALLRDAGRGLVLVINKWDTVDTERRFDLERELDRLLGFAAWAPRINISALTGRGTRRVLPTLVRVWEEYLRRIPTSDLNRFLREAIDHNPPPLQGGRTVRVRYLTQAETAPPKFIAFANREIPAAWRRWLERRIRETWGFEGVPIAVEQRRGGRRSDD
ncbi:ribosome biogenesis GTPase Der [Salsipaludibacter albus]|uniref:ribosome biogenesis GTPase Der n=1 Tax=Salsipaludibacter albus TaxID=2849650 RepID=UPI001EE4E589|nr:ribosome biogenesis GTPase Der [Salsipaludibacter albus]MBY5162848.1 ribosome biogenesis GTPase Der [Salsipaludibacter albus]